MPDLYLDVLCSDCQMNHDLYNADTAQYGSGCSYKYMCPVTGQTVPITISYPDATVNVVPIGAIPLTWLADRCAPE
jgi:hypothetical protein